MNQRMWEIWETCSALGVAPPLPMDELIEIEADGHAVDLLTGEVLTGAADWRVESTVVGEATAVILRADEEVGA